MKTLDRTPTIIILAQTVKTAEGYARRNKMTHYLAVSPRSLTRLYGATAAALVNVQGVSLSPRQLGMVLACFEGSLYPIQIELHGIWRSRP